MDDGLGPIELEFLINNSQLEADAGKAEATLQEVTDRATINAKKAAEAISNMQRVTIDELKSRAATYNSIAEVTTDPAKLVKYNQLLEQTTQDIARMKNAGKTGFDELGNALPVEQTGKFGAAIAKVTDLQTVGARVVTMFSRQIIGLGVAFLSMEIGAKAIKALIDWVSKLDIFSGRLDQAKQNLAALNEVMASADKDAGKQITNLKILYAAATDVTNSTKDRTAAARELKREFPDAFANSKLTAILNGEESKTYQQLTQDVLANARAKAAASKIADLAAKQLDADHQEQKIKIAHANELTQIANEPSLKIKFKTDGGRLRSDVEVQNSNQRAADALQEQEENKKVLQGQIDFLTKYVGGNNALAKGIEKSTAKDDAKADAESLKAKLALLQQISQAEEAFNRKAMTQDQAALTAISDKYDELTVKIKAFNADPKNKNNIIGSSDIAGMRTAENGDIDNQANLNENKYIQQDIDKKKKLYADYEVYKTKLGADAANKEFADLLKSGKDYQTYLNNLENSIPADDTSGPIRERRDAVRKELESEALRQKEHLEKLLEGLKSYEEQRTILTNTYEANRALLAKNGRTAEIAQLDEQYKKELGQLDDANFEKLQSVKELQSGITNLSHEAAKKLIADVQAELNARIAAGTITAAEAKKVQDLIDKSTAALGKDLAGELARAASGLKEMANAAALFNTDLGDSINLLADIVGGIGKAASAYKDFQTAQQKKDTLGQITSGLGLVGAAIGVVTAVVGFFKAAHDTAVQAAAQLRAYQDSLLGSEVKYNQLLRDRERTLTDISKLTLAQLKTQEQALALQKQQAQVDYNNLLSQIQGRGQQITGEHTTKYGGFLGIGRKTKVVQDLAGLSGADYDSLEKLYTEGKLTDATKTWFEQLQSVKKELDDIGTSTQAAVDQLNQIATGTTADAISKAIITGFENGKRTAADFADDFKGLMQQAAISVFESNYLSGKIADFYKQFAAASASDGGLTPDKIAALKAAYSKVIGDAGVQFDNLQKVVGTVASSTSASATLSGQIKGITENQANQLEGAINGLRLTNFLTNDLLKANGKTLGDQLGELRGQTLLQMQIAANTKRTADNTDGIKDSLKNIDTNTSAQNLANALRAAGHI